MKSVRKRKWCFYPQFSLRLLIALMVVPAIGLGVFDYQRRKHQVNLAAKSSFAYGFEIQVRSSFDQIERRCDSNGPFPGDEIVEIRSHGGFRRLQELQPVETTMLDEFQFEKSLQAPFFASPAAQQAAVRRLAKLPQIKRLCLTGMTVSGDELTAAVGQLQTLEFLGLNHVGLLDNHLKHLASLKNLRYLSLGGNPITTAGIRRLGTLPDLRVLELGYTLVDDALLHELHRFPNLTHLYLDWTAIRSLDLKPPLNLEYLLVSSDLPSLRIGSGCRIEALGVAGTKFRLLPPPIFPSTNCGSLVEHYQPPNMFTAKVLTQIDPASGLKRLHVAGVPITLRAIAAAGLGQNLEALTISAPCIDESALDPQAFPHLKTIIAPDVMHCGPPTQRPSRKFSQVTIQTQMGWGSYGDPFGSNP